MARLKDLCFGVRAFQMLPRRLCTPIGSTETILFIGEYKSIRMGVSEREVVFVRTHFCLHLYACFNDGGSLTAAEQLVVRPSLPLNKLLKLVGPEHPAQQVEEAHEIGLARAVGAEHNCGVR